MKSTNKKKPENKENRNKWEKKPSQESNSKGYIPGKNDWKWYAPTEQIAKDIASLPFNHMSGTPWNMEFTTEDGVIERNAFRSGSICVYDYALSTGGGDPSRADGINMAAKQLYTEVRRNNSGAKNYEAPDLMMYILAMREVYALFFTIKRLLGVANTFTFENRAFPQAIFKALGCEDYSETVSNIAQLRGRLNLLASQINSFAVPKYFKVFMRDAWVASNIFADSTSLMGQFYAYKLKFTRSWSGENGSHLVTDFCANTVTELLDQLTDALQKLFDDTDINTMAGDIVKAFGEGELYTVAEMSEVYAIIPTYDEDMLNQIQNSVCYKLEERGIQDAESLNITQDVTTQTIVFSPEVSFNSSGTYLLDSFVFNSHKDNPDYTSVLEWSRLMTVTYIKKIEEDIAYFGVITGAELLTGGTVYFVNGVDDVVSYEIPEPASIQFPTNVNNLFVYNTFDWHPIVYIKTGDQNYLICGDVKKATLVNKDIIARIHDAAMYALFYLNK